VAGLLYVCPAGRYGASTAMSDNQCSGACSIPGFYCPTGSTSPVKHVCGGDNVFCPGGTKGDAALGVSAVDGKVAPISVQAGFYTVDYEYSQCPPGKWRADSSVWVCELIVN